MEMKILVRFANRLGIYNPTCVRKVVAMDLGLLQITSVRVAQLLNAIDVIQIKMFAHNVLPLIFYNLVNAHLNVVRVLN
jgi:hypothetical protein